MLFCLSLHAECFCINLGSHTSVVMTSHVKLLKLSTSASDCYCVFAGAEDHGAAGEVDDDTVVVEDNEADDGDAVMVDALEALRLSQPHMAHVSYDGSHTDENQRPQTASGSRHASGDHSFSNEGPSDKGLGSSKGSPPSRKRNNHRLIPFGEGPMWARFGTGTSDDSDCTGAMHEFGGNSSLVQSGLQSRLAEAAEDMHNVDDDEVDGQQSRDATFNSAQYWKTPLAMPQDIETA